jgi:hypothetical protein
MEKQAATIKKLEEAKLRELSDAEAVEDYDIINGYRLGADEISDEDSGDIQLRMYGAEASPRPTPERIAEVCDERKLFWAKNRAEITEKYVALMLKALLSA